MDITHKPRMTGAKSGGLKLQCIQLQAFLVELRIVKRENVSRSEHFNREFACSVRFGSCLV